MMNGRNAGPDVSVAADTNSIANCLASLLHEIEVVALRINDGRSRLLAPLERDHCASKGRVDGRRSPRRPSTAAER